MNFSSKYDFCEANFCWFVVASRSPMLNLLFNTRVAPCRICLLKILKKLLEPVAKVYRILATFLLDVIDCLMVSSFTNLRLGLAYIGDKVMG